MLYGIFNLIIDTIAGVLGGVLLLRFWMQAVRVRPPNTIGQFVYTLSDWLVKPLRRLLPGAGGYDWASLIGALLVLLAANAIKLAIVSAFAPGILIQLSVLRLAEWAFYGLMGLIIIEVIFSWVNPHAPLAPFVRALNEPVMRPLRRVIPPLGGIDLTPLVALILLQIGLRIVTSLIAAV